MDPTLCAAPAFLPRLMALSTTLAISLSMLAGCYMPEVTVVETEGTTIHKIGIGTAAAFLLEGELGNVLIDAATHQDRFSLHQGLEEAGFPPGTVDGLLLTHGHFDHAGGAFAMQEDWGTDLWVGEPDVDMLENGGKHDVHITSWEGPIVLAISDMSYPPVFADHTVSSAGMTLRDRWGIPGDVISTPGHTGGSLTVVLDSGEAFTGDLYRTQLGGVVTHMFSDDLPSDVANVQSLVDQGVTHFYPAHGEDVDVAEIQTWLATNPAGAE